MDGAPSDIYALAQAADGTLWIGGATGLTRFDGIRFVPYPGPSEEPLQSTNISSLLVTREGALWIGFRPGGVSQLKNGRVTNYGERQGLPNGTVAQIAEDRDGAIWAAARTGLARLNGDRWERIAEAGLEFPYGVLIDSADTIWVAAAGGLHARSRGAARFRRLDTRAYFSPRGSVLAKGPDGAIWSAAPQEFVRTYRDSKPQQVVSVDGVEGGPLLFDHDGALWAWDDDAKELLRIPPSTVTGAIEGGRSTAPERFTNADGLSARVVFAILADRENSVWLGTSNGLHRFSHSNVVRDAAPPCFQDLSITGAMAAGHAGALWLACDDGSMTHVSEIRDGTVINRQAAPAFNMAYRDPDGVVWFGGSSALGRIESGRLRVMPLPAHLRGRPVQALARDGSGGLWVSLSRRGIYRYLDGKWTLRGGITGLPQTYANVATAAADGSVWFGFQDSRIAILRGQQVQMFGREHGLALGNILAIHSHGPDVWIGGELGLAHFDGVRFAPVNTSTTTSIKGVSGIVRARNGDLWLNGIGGIVRIDNGEVGRFLRNRGYQPACETFNYLDGVPGVAVQLRPQPSAIETTDGRIWFSMTAGIVSIDVKQMIRNELPPPVAIWSLTSGSAHFPDRGMELQLPEKTTDVRISYTAGSLTIPERVRFRYRLDDLDRDWKEVGSRREAVYTNLGPGRYAFKVIAANNDGVWNESGATLRFRILPAFYQTWWFYVACGVACLAVLAAIYRIRVRQVAAQVRSRLEARLAERERIARELHDTLLQGMQGLILRFQAAADCIPREEPARLLMEQSLDRADELLGEGRDRVKDLRLATSDQSDLDQSLAALGKQFAELHSTGFRVRIQGTSRNLHLIVFEEVLLIAREALANAFVHANAAEIEAEVTYGESALHVRIRDDGQGISTSVLDAGGMPGHFGLIGIRERANKLGANLEIWSRSGAGTEVDLRVPAHVAYKSTQAAPHGLRSWLAKLLTSLREH